MKKLFKLGVLVTLTFFFTGVTISTSINLTHTFDTEDPEFDLPSMGIQDQPSVDGIVSFRVTFNHTGIIVVMKDETMVGHGFFQASSGVADHHQPNLVLTQHPHNSSTGIPVHGMTIRVNVKLSELVQLGDQLHVKLIVDHNGNSLIDGMDEVVMDSTGSNVEGFFELLSEEVTTMEVQDQTIHSDNMHISIDRSIVPGPAWQVIHLNDEGALGALVSQKIPLYHGLNEDIVLDITDADLLTMGLIESGDSVELFAHLHHDQYNRYDFNATEDPHIFSSQFNSPVIGNDSAELFTLTLGESNTDDSPTNLYFTTFSLIILVWVKERNWFKS